MKPYRKEDYLRLIYLLEEKEGIKSIEIARELKITKASVSEMLRKLEKEGFIKKERYSKIFLTRKGKKFGEECFDRYYLIKSFLKKYFNYDEKKAKEEAHELEHVFSEESIQKIKGLIESSSFQPDYIN